MKNCQTQEKPQSDTSEDESKIQSANTQRIFKDKDACKKIVGNQAKPQNIWRSLYELLFEVWSPDEDPAHYYFQTLSSLQDYDLLKQFMRKKKVAGIFVIIILANIANLLIPENCDEFSPPFSENKQYGIPAEGIKKDSKYFAFKTECWRYLINLMMASVLLAVSFYVVFCNQSTLVAKINGRFELVAAISAQYLMVTLLCLCLQTFCFVMFPNLFMYQFLVNITILFTVVMKECIKKEKEILILIANTFLINYVAVEGIRYYQLESLSQKTQISNNQQNINSYLPGYEETTRAYLIGLVVYCLVVVQNQKLNQSLTKMLVQKIQTLQHSLDIKDTYNASMIHELRNPLNAVLGAIGLLKYSRSLSKEDHETLNIASMSGEILITLINNALDGAKIEANKLELDCHKCDIIDTLTKTASLFQWKAREKKINISLKIGKQIPSLVEIDEARITQILVNIIGNAVKFTPESGEVKVRAQFQAVEEQTSAAIDVKQKLSSFHHQMNSAGSYLEEDELELKFFDNKELLMDMGLESDDDEEDLKKANEQHKSMATPGTQTPHEYEMDSMTDKSQEPLNFHHLSNNQEFITMDMMKNESFSSIIGAEQFEERRNRSKSNMGQRELDFKNSFHEWAANTQQLSNPANIPTYTSPDPVHGVLEQNGTQQIQIDIQPSTTLTKQPYSGERQQQNIQIVSRNSQAFSESFQRDASFSIDSNFGGAKNCRTFTNSLSSNTCALKKRNPPKSKFYQQMESDNLNDLSDEDGDHHYHHHKHQTYNQRSPQSNDNEQSERVFREQIKSLDLQALREEQGTQDCKGQLIIEVIDSGIGISQEGIKKLFQPFQQADKGIQAKYGGTGLGLWITNKLVGIMRGKIEVSSELNKGTVFTIKIPVIGEYRERYSPLKEDLMENHGTQGTGNQMGSLTSSEQRIPRLRLSQQNVRRESSIDEFTVLLFQRDEIMTKLFKKYMQKHNIKFKFSTNFKDLLRSFRFQKYNACFLDIDINVTADDLDKLVSYISSLESDDKNSICQVFCLYSRDIDKGKMKILQRNNIKTIKKPIQGYQLSQILRRCKTNSLQTSNKKVSALENNQTFEDNRTSTFNKIGMIQKKDFQQSYMTKKTSGYSFMNDNQMMQSNQLSNSIEQKFFEDPLFAKLHANDEFQITDTANFRQSIIGQNEEEVIMGQAPPFHYSSAQKPIPSQFQMEDVNQRESSSSSSTHDDQQQSQQFAPDKISRQLDRVRLTDQILQQNSPRVSDRRAKSPIVITQFSSDRKMLQQKLSNEMENLLIKNAGGNLSARSQKKDAFRHSNMHSDEEEKKSYKVNTPNFNNLSSQSLQTNKALSSSKNTEIETSPTKIQQPIQEKSNSLTFCGQLRKEHSYNTDKQHSSHKLEKQESKLSKGATFKLEKVTPKLMPRKAILIVDDNKMNQFIVQKMLEKVPFIIQNRIELIVADDGEQAYQRFLLEQAKDTGVKLILMDCEMPVLDGYEAAKKIRDAETAQNYEAILIIGLSGNQGEQHTRKCKLAGMNDAITKPIVFDQLNALVKRALDQSSNTLMNTAQESRGSRLTKSNDANKVQVRKRNSKNRLTIKVSYEEDEECKDDQSQSHKYRSQN